MLDANAPKDCDIILGNSNSRFSGVTSTMLQTLEHQQKIMNICVLGAHHLRDSSMAISFIEALRLCRRKPSQGKYRVFHARRNNEILQALLLRMFSKGQLRILFTSTAQRHHTRFTKYLMSKVDKVISTCQAAASYLHPAPSAIVPHGIDTRSYTPGPTPKVLTKETNICIAIFGRVRPQKGTHLLVEACLKLFPQHSNCETWIIGAIKETEQAYVAELQHKIDNAGLTDRIRFLGEQAFSQLPQLFRSADIVTALSHNEGFGLTVLEAMSSGAAVIATKAGAWPEIIREGIDGYIVDTDDVHAVQQRLSILLSKPEKISDMGKNGRQRILDNYTIENEAETLCGIYKAMQVG